MAAEVWKWSMGTSVRLQEIREKTVSCKIIQIPAVFRRQNNEKPECLPND